MRRSVWLGVLGLSLLTFVLAGCAFFEEDEELRVYSLYVLNDCALSQFLGDGVYVTVQGGVQMQWTTLDHGENYVFFFGDVPWINVGATLRNLPNLGDVYLGGISNIDSPFMTGKGEGAIEVTVLDKKGICFNGPPSD